MSDLPYRYPISISHIDIVSCIVTLHAGCASHGRAVQVDPIKFTLKAPGTKRLKLSHDDPLSDFAFKINLHRYRMDYETASSIINTKVGRCRLYLSPLNYDKVRETT